MRQSTRLIVNSAVTYSRMIVTVGIGLLITRLLIRTLGISDFGLLTALGASGILLSIFRDAFTESCTRFLAHEIGRGDEKALQKVFASGMWVHIAAAAISIVLGIVVMVLVIQAADIPEGRQVAAWWVLGATLFGLVSTMVLTPYSALITAYQEIPIRTAFELAGRLITLGIVLLLQVFSTDRLVTYTVMLACATLLVELGLVAVCLKRYPVCRHGLTGATRASVWEQVSFGGWSILSSTIIRIRMQGTIFILNVLFGTVVNAAYAIAVQASGYQSKLNWAMMSAIRPAMTTMYGRSGQSKGVIDLVCMANKFPFYMSLLLFVPVYWETEALLMLWLGEYPDWTPLFIRIVMATTLINTISNGYTVLMSSRGELRGITVLGIVFQVSAISVGWLGTAIADWGPEGFLWSAFVSISLFSIVRVFFVSKVTGLSVMDYLRHSMAPIFIVSALVFALSSLLYYSIPEGLARLSVLSAVSMACTFLACWVFGMTEMEKEHFKRIFGKVASITRRTNDIK